MKKQSNLGFTLVELLAVIVILAIILSITIPNISSLIKNATKNAFEDDVKMVLKAINYKILEDASYDIKQIDVNKIDTDLKLSNANYESVMVTTDEGTPYILINGKNKWSNLSACGTYKNIIVKENEGCPRYLYNKGDYASNFVQGYNYNADEISKQQDYLYAKATGAVLIDETWIRNEGAWVINSKIDLTSYNTLHYIANVDSIMAVGGGGLNVCISTIKSDIYNVGCDVQKYTSYNYFVDGKLAEITIDVSALVGEYYIRFHAVGGNYMGNLTTYFKLYESWLD